MCINHSIGYSLLQEEILILFTSWEFEFMFFRVLDRNSDGKITYQDLEDLCVRYLTNQTPTNLRGSERVADTRGSGVQ